MAAKTEVRTELKLDDLASATLAKIQSGFKRVEATVNMAQSRVLAFASQTAAMAIGVNIGNIVGGIQDIATGAVRAALEGQEQMRALTKTIAGMSTVRGVGLEGFDKSAKDAYETIRKMSIESGVARGELVAAFSELGANTSRTKEQVLDLMGKVTSAARALPAPVGDIVKGFGEIEKNTISASNPLIEMVKQANLMRGHNEQIALRLQMMGRQGMLNLMLKALKEMQERAKKMPMTLKDMGNMLHDMKTDVMRIIGEPMVRAITPAFKNLYDKIMENRGAIERYAKMVGEKAGEWITEAAKKTEEGFKYVQSHAEEIKAAIKEAFEFAKSVIDFAIKHKTALALGVVATKAATPTIEGTKSVLEFGRALTTLAKTGIPELGIAASGAAAGLGGIAITLGAFALALGAVTAAVWQFSKYLEETHGHLTPSAGMAEENVTARIGAFERLAKDYHVLSVQQAKDYDYIRAKAIQEAEAAGQNAAAVGERIDALYREHKALVDATRDMQRAEAFLNRIPADIASRSEEDQVAAARQTQEALDLFMKNYNEVSAAGNKAAMEAAAQIVIGNKRLQIAMLQGGDDISKGLAELADIIGDRAKDFVDKVKTKLGEQEKAAKTEGPVANNIFNGGQVFQIKQDFRDQDPDRIAVIFQRDIARAAESRLQARTALPFGG
jgi:hypothetical protein